MSYVFGHRTNFYSRGPIQGHRGEYKFQMIQSEPDEIVTGRQYAVDLRMWQSHQLAKLSGWQLIISDQTPHDSKALGFPYRRGWMGFRFERVYIYHDPRGRPSSGWLGGTIDKQNPALMVGLVKPKKKLVEIDPDQLRGIGMAAYEYGFKPLLAYATQFEPFTTATATA